MPEPSYENTPITIQAGMPEEELTLAHPPGKRVHVQVIDIYGKDVHPVTLVGYTNRVEITVREDQVDPMRWPLTAIMTHIP